MGRRAHQQAVASLGNRRRELCPNTRCFCLNHSSIDGSMAVRLIPLQIVSMSEMIDRWARPNEAAAGRARVEGSIRGASQLAQALARMVASKTRLASELGVLFRASRGLPLRLALSDHRRATKIQADRLQRTITMVAGRDHLSMPPRPNDGVDVACAAALPLAAVVATLLRTSEAAVAQYEAAIAIAAEGRLASAVNLLTISLNDELAAGRRLSAMAASLTRE